MGTIQIEHLTYEYESRGQRFRALDDLSMEIKEGEFVCLVGHSGCGKTTLLNLIAGLLSPTSGQIRIDGRPVTGPGLDRNVIFQHYSLFPWLTAEKNVAFGLRQAQPEISKKQALERARRFLKEVELESVKDKYPYQLSGGMQQRVAIARTLANDPDVVLMDEPFGALDAYTRIVLQKELLNIWEKHKKTILFVTHSVDEAIYLADRIILMSRDCGKILREDRVNLPRLRDRSDPEYARLTKELLEELERVNSTPR